MEIFGLLQTIIIIYKEFKFFSYTYVYKSVTWTRKLHVPKINKVMSKSL